MKRYNQYSEEDKAWLIEDWEKSLKWTGTGGAQGSFEAGGKLEDADQQQDLRIRCALVVEHGSVRILLPAGVTSRDLAVVVNALV
jgi:hypothetical protein